MSIWFKSGLLVLASFTLFYLFSASEIKTNLITDNSNSSNILPVRKILPMTFAHADHNQQQCVTCHHNFQDNTGQGLCIECHITNSDIAFKFREQFHNLCIGCHVEQEQTDSDKVGINKVGRDKVGRDKVGRDKVGPLRRCIACHTADEHP